jgi:hypothetical protein
VRYDDRLGSFAWPISPSRMPCTAAVSADGRLGEDVEILALHHQITVLKRRLGANTRLRFAPKDQALLAALLTSLSR